MATETLTIFKVDTGAAVENLADLRNNIKILKEELNKLDIGSKEYKDTLNQLEVNQAALKNAMHGTATSMEQITAAAKGQDQSYNGLVRTMAKYKEELRAIDISTEEGKKAFEDKAAQIKGVNDKLKDLDALQGNFQRNVGNYKSGVAGLADAFKATAGNASGILAPLGLLRKALDALKAHPIIATLGALSFVLTKIISSLKSSEENTNAWNRALAGFKPIADAATRAIQAIGTAITGVVTWVENLLEKWGLLNAELSDARQQMVDDNVEITNLNRKYMVENAKLQAEIDEIREKAENREKYSKEERIKMLQDAAKKEEKIFQNEVDLAQRRFDLAKREASLTDNNKETNDRLAQLEADLIAKRSARAKVMRRLTTQINSIRREGASVAKQTSQEEVQADTATLMTWEQMESEAKRREGLLSESRQMAEQSEQGFTAFLEEQNEAQLESVTAMLDAQLDAEWGALEEEKRIQKERMDTFMAFSDTLGSVFSAVADIYEADAEADEQAAKKSKALRTAAAIVSTISGAVSAFMSTWKAEELPLSVKAVLAPVNAASVLAAGYAQVKQINAVKIGNSAGASVTAPSFSPQIANVRQVTGQNEQLLLNQKQRVYLVYSDLQVANTNQRVKVQETEF